MLITVQSSQSRLMYVWFIKTLKLGFCKGSLADPNRHRRQLGFINVSPFWASVSAPRYAALTWKERDRVHQRFPAVKARYECHMSTVK